MDRAVETRPGSRAVALGMIPYVLIAFFLVLLDQLLKVLALAHLSPVSSVPFGGALAWLGRVARLTLTFNEGAAFGMFWDKQAFFLALTVLAVAAIAVAFGRSRPEAVLYRTALVLLCAGAVGNLIDRLRFGYVIDYFDLGFWPVFNLADVMLDTGAALLVLALFRPRPEPRNKRGQGS